MLRDTTVLKDELDSSRSNLKLLRTTCKGVIADNVHERKVLTQLCATLHQIARMGVTSNQQSLMEDVAEQLRLADEARGQVITRLKANVTGPLDELIKAVDHQQDALRTRNNAIKKGLPVEPLALVSIEDVEKRRIQGDVRALKELLQCQAHLHARELEVSAQAFKVVTRFEASDECAKFKQDLIDSNISMAHGVSSGH